MKSSLADYLYEEMAFVAYYLHWSRDELISLEHAEPRPWCAEISRINRNSTAPGNPFDNA
jgi:hypothetical protein